MIAIIEYGQNLVKLLYYNSFVAIKIYCIPIVLIRIQDAFTPLSSRVILTVSTCFYMNMNCFGPDRVVSTWLQVGSWLRIVFDGWLQMVTGGLGWFRVVCCLLIATFKNTLFT